MAGSSTESTGVGVEGTLSDPRQKENGGMHSDDSLEQQRPKPKSDEDKRKQEALVKKRWKNYDKARSFDENFRKQIAIDRRYAAGTSDLAWAVDTNIIGAFIDILVSLLYAKDPDVSAKKTPQVDNSNSLPMDQFAKTVQIVISQLWKRGRLKKAARKGVRSVLSVAEGWLKANLLTDDKPPQPETMTALNSAKETLARLEAQVALLEDPDGKDPETIETELAQKKALIETLEEKLEASITHMFVIDFVKAENIQVSTDVDQISDYLDANWISDEMFIEEEDVLERFPDVTPEELTQAKKYYAKAPKELTTRETDNVLPQGQMTAESAQAFTTSGSDPESPVFYRCIEQWDRLDKHIYTMIEGLKKWPKEPFQECYPTSRFFPYFCFSFYEVDGARHPQSLSWRLYKLQDEYSSTRSNFRITRERSIPGILFNATNLDAEQAKKLADAKHQEYTGLTPGDPTQPLSDLFAEKPVSKVDMRVFDVTMILNDMERMSGVQEALSSANSAPGNPQTATEANIQQSGTQARTSADRDALEEMLTELARYTVEQALQCLSLKEVQRLAGQAAYWPVGMEIDDLFTLVEVQLQAGSTGKPDKSTDQQAWATVLPLIKQTLQEIEQALASGNTALAKVYTELVKETMIRMGDESDPDRFIPQSPPPNSAGGGAPRPPIIPNVTVALKGVLDPQTAATLVAPAVKIDSAFMAPPAPPPGSPGGPSPGTPPAPAGPMPALSPAPPPS
jgi:hypothetical protein